MLLTAPGVQKNVDIQREWDNRDLQETWPSNRDHAFVMQRLAEVPVEETARGATGPVLEVAAAEAVHSCRLNRRGLACVVLEPSPAMLVRARARAAEFDARLMLVRGIAETLPFPDGTFDRVLCDSAIDHLLHPDVAVREMTRVLRPDGRLLISFVNYGSLSTRLSRAVYRIARRGVTPKPEQYRFWDTPVPIEHTFECSLPVVRELCEPYLELERVVGVSLGWAIPGWPKLLGRLSAPAAERLLAALNGLARRVPALADFVMTIWRRRRAVSATSNGGLPLESLRVRPTDPAYQWRAKVEAERSSPLLPFADRDRDTEVASRRIVNTAITGDPERSWLDDLIARGPFARAAMLGCEEPDHVASWVRAGASRRLDVYEPGAAMMQTLRAVVRRARVGAASPTEVGFVRADLNFVALPAERYDLVWSSDVLMRVVNLEYLLGQIEHALRPGGLFALNDYVGERRLQYDPGRLARVDAVLADVPSRFRVDGGGPLAPVPQHLLTPLCAVRSDELLPLAEARFDVVHRVMAGMFFPLFRVLDLGKLTREAPEILARLVEAEARALRDPSLRPCTAYVVFRRRARP